MSRTKVGGFSHILGSVIGSGIEYKVRSNGGRLYLVGGAVRDTLLGKRPKDYDFVIIGMGMKKFEEIFSDSKHIGGSSLITGKKLPVYLLEGHEVALGRGEIKVGDSRLDFDWEYAETIDEDLFRRDFTINAMAIDLHTDELVDPFNGRDDLNRGVIRHVNTETFLEDELRVYRGLVKASQLNFEIAVRTKILMEIIIQSGDLLKLPVERVFEEFKKALKSDNPERFFIELKDIKGLRVHFPEIADLVGVPQPVKSHPEGDVFSHTILTLKMMSSRTKDVVMRFCSLVHDLGKGRTNEELLPKHYGHSKEGLEPFHNLCNRLKLPNKWRIAGELVILEHMRCRLWVEMKPKKVIKLYEKCKKSPIGVIGLGQIAISDSNGRGQGEFIPQPDIRKFIELGCRVFEEVTGEDVKGDFEGKAFGDELRRLRCKWFYEERKKY